jgi:AraC family transcriptional regulator, regulatory protein of adaptative response / methylated-DNA-[protein]-cysteine methyltransferase
MTHVPYTTDDERWQAVSRRDRRADGMFYYVVRTTGVYSRPSCVSRTARRRNVIFFSTIEEARDHGYRACRRCRPDEPESPERRHAAAVREACARIDNSTQAPTLEELATAAGFSRFHFHRIFKAVTGVTPHAYLAARRGHRARRELSTADTITDAIYRSGFNSSGRFYAEMPEILGMTPSSFRGGGLGTSIRYSIGESSLGPALVAAADRGVCAVLLGGPACALLRRLRTLFPRARLLGRDAGFRSVVSDALDSAGPPAVCRLLPPEVQHTALRLRVCQALRDRAQDVAA